jgi:NADH:ubiquinone reductase (H+-translocating)
MMNKNALSDQHVIVIGAGYAGLMCALQLAPHVRVTLVDPAGHFTERVRSHELATGRPDITHPLREFLAPAGITQVPGRVTGIVPRAREIRTGDGRVLRYDRLVYAAGSRTAHPGPAPADPISTGPVYAGPISARPISARPISARPASPGHVFTPESAAELHKRLRDGPGSLAVVGGGLTGLELAAEIAEAEPRWAVGLITAGQVGPGLSGPGRDHVRRVLGARGVRLDEGHRVTGPADIDADVVVWAASMAARTELAAAAGLALTGGRIAVGPALRSISDPRIYAAGDAAASVSPAAGQLRMACATALPTGAHAARAVLADLRGEEAAPLRYRFFLQCISLGRRDGLVQLVHADDCPGRQIITGRAAATAKEQVVRSTVRTLRLAVRHQGAARHVLGMS